MKTQTPAVLESQALAKSSYELEVEVMRAIRERAERRGKILIRGGDRPWEQTRQGRIRYYLSREALQDTAFKDWSVFVHEIRSQSGRHRHQGGLVIYVIEGKGYTVINDRRVDWEAGDLLLLPIRPGGVEHQHFNADPERPAKWIAFIYKPFFDELGSMGIEHREDAPESHR